MLILVLTEICIPKRLSTLKMHIYIYKYKNNLNTNNIIIIIAIRKCY